MSTARSPKRKIPPLLWVLIPAAAVMLFVGANGHLIYVAVQSQPECVAHLKQPGTGGQFRAAKPAC